MNQEAVKAIQAKARGQQELPPSPPTHPDTVEGAPQGVKAMTPAQINEMRKDIGVGTPPAQPQEKGVQTQGSPGEPPSQEPSREETADQKGVDVAPPAKPAETSTEEEPVPPKRAWDGLTARKEALEAESKSLKDANRELQRQLEEVNRSQNFEAVARAEKPEGYEEWAPDRQSAYMADRVVRGDIDRMQATITELQAEQRRQLIGQVVTGMDHDQTTIVQDVMGATGLTDPREAVALAKMRFPDSFAAAEAVPVIAPSHQVVAPSNPGHAAVPQPSETETDQETILGSGGLKGRMEAMQRVVKRRQFGQAQ